MLLQWHYFIPFYGLVLFSLTHTHRHIFFIHSSVIRLSGFLHVLAVVSRAAANVRVHLSFQIRVCLDMCPRMGLLNHMACVFILRASKRRHFQLHIGAITFYYI